MEMSMERRKTCGKSEMDGREKQCIGNNLGRILKVLGKLLQSTQCKRAEEGEMVKNDYKDALLMPDIIYTSYTMICITISSQKSITKTNSNVHCSRM